MYRCGVLGGPNPEVMNRSLQNGGGIDLLKMDSFEYTGNSHIEWICRSAISCETIDRVLTGSPIFNSQPNSISHDGGTGTEASIPRSAASAPTPSPSTPVQAKASLKGRRQSAASARKKSLQQTDEERIKSEPVLPSSSTNVAAAAAPTHPNSTAVDVNKLQVRTIKWESSLIPASPVGPFGIPEKSMRCLELIEGVTQLVPLMAFGVDHNLSPTESLNQFTERYSRRTLSLTSIDGSGHMTSVARQQPPPPQRKASTSSFFGGNGSSIHENLMANSDGTNGSVLINQEGNPNHPENGSTCPTPLFMSSSTTHNQTQGQNVTSAAATNKKKNPKDSINGSLNESSSMIHDSPDNLTHHHHHHRDTSESHNHNQVVVHPKGGIEPSGSSSVINATSHLQSSSPSGRPTLIDTNTQANNLHGPGSGAGGPLNSKSNHETSGNNSLHHHGHRASQNLDGGGGGTGANGSYGKRESSSSGGSSSSSGSGNSHLHSTNNLGGGSGGGTGNPHLKRRASSGSLNLDLQHRPVSCSSSSSSSPTNPSSTTTTTTTGILHHPHHPSSSSSRTRARLSSKSSSSS